MAVLVPETLKHTSQLLKRVSILFACTVALLIAVTAWALLRPATVPAYSPLGDFPVQTITTSQPIPVGDDVGVTATQCNNSDKPAKVVGVSRWVAIEPLGSSFIGNQGQGVRPPGCATFHFENVMPADVQARVRQLAATGVHITTWVIQGTATPIAPNGDRAVVKAYTTERFQISA